ncbi:MAG: S-methyl-5-thioribose-1-phosphate isomerase [Planctomycetes bacterium]|nr:S-methyl-5-thioribose-1-phosphate isomerase [Planctomycetota bacterium]
MNVNGEPYRTIWLAEDGWAVNVIDQTRLPHEFAVLRLATLREAASAITTMVVRGAPLIGATAAYGVCLAMRADPRDEALSSACAMLAATRPTAVNLQWALSAMRDALTGLPPSARADAAYRLAAEICDQDVAASRAIGEHGLALIRDLFPRRRQPDCVNLLTHCNAGWLATVDWGTALAPVYMAHDEGIPVHVWVDETRPRNQGAALTAWELMQHGVPHTVIVDSAGGHLMQQGLVDACITGTDRTTARGDVCNKIGTYLKALAAHDNGVPFYVAVPSSSIDWSIDGEPMRIPIEQRPVTEVSRVTGRSDDGEIISVQVTPDGSPVANHAFDVTPARLVTALITDRGVCAADRDGLGSLYPEHRAGAPLPA